MGPEQAPRRRCRVVVIGAGASGLMAAHALLPKLRSSSTSEATKEPLLVLEARDRVGGRIKTTPIKVSKLDGSSVEVPVDMGAAFVHGTGAPFGSDGRGREDELNPMVKLLRHVNTADGDDADSSSDDKDPLRAKLIYAFPNGNPDTRPRDVLHAPRAGVKELYDVGDGNDTSSTAESEASEEPQHLVALYVAGRQVDPASPAILRALDLYERLLSSASRVGAAAYECGEGMTTTTISIGRAIDVVRKEAPASYGLGYSFGNKGKDVDGDLVETLLGYYFHLIQMWHPHSLSKVQLSEFIVDDDDSTNEEHFWEGCDGDFPGPHCNVQGGMENIFAPLLDCGVKECLLCGQEVKTIEKDGDNGYIVVSCKSGLAVEAEYCIVTIPIGCLKDAIETKGNAGMFHPALSADKQDAITSLQMGGYKKIFLTFDCVFWPKDQPYFGVIRERLNGKMMLGRDDTEGVGNYLHVDNSWAKDGIPCLEVTLAGSSAVWANGRGCEEIRKEVIMSLDDAIFVEDGTSFSSRCTDCHITRWEEDVFSKGAYAGFVLGTLESHAQELAEAEWGGKLLFAGDAVIAEYEGSVHGALLSGQKAAESVLIDIK